MNTQNTTQEEHSLSYVEGNLKINARSYDSSFIIDSKRETISLIEQDIITMSHSLKSKKDGTTSTAQSKFYDMLDNINNKNYDTEKIVSVICDIVRSRKEELNNATLRQHLNNKAEAQLLTIEIDDKDLLDFNLATETNKGDLIYTDIKSIDELAIYEQNNTMLFTRKSPSNSKADPKEAFNGKTAEALFLAPSSSGFFDTAILRACNYCTMNNIEILEVCTYGTRTAEETATRSLEIAKKLVDYTRRYELQVLVNGIDLRTMNGEIFIMLIGLIAETKSVQNSHTKYSSKHATYLEVLKSGNWDDLNKEQVRELLSLIRYNGSQKKAISFMNALLRKSKK
jgi:hypothetical protein